MMGTLGAFFNFFAEIRMQNDNDNSALEPRNPFHPRQSEHLRKRRSAGGRKNPWNCRKNWVGVAVQSRRGLVTGKSTAGRSISEEIIPVEFSS